jgi:hypothetical protein
MGMEHYYQFFDREVVDPFLALTWRAFDKKHGWSDACQWSSAAQFLSEYALEPPPADHRIVERILASRTLRWTLCHSSAQYLCFSEGLLVHAPAIEKRCPATEPPGLEEAGLFRAAAVHGFLHGRTGRRTLCAAFAITGWAGEFEWLALPPDRGKIVRAALDGTLSRPIFPWQDQSCLAVGFDALSLADTRRFLDFVRAAWAEKWPCPYLLPEVGRKLSLPENRAPTLRDSPTAEFMRCCASSRRLRQPCLIRYFGI